MYSRGEKERRIVFAVGLALLLLFTFTDLQISMAIAKKPLWARVFEVVGEIPFTTLTIAACAILFRFHSLEPILGTKDTKNDYLNPYTREPSQNPPTFLTVGEHDFLKMETLGYGVKLHKAGVETKMVLYKGFGHAYFDNTGVYPQTEDCIEEMADFILKHCEK